MDMDTLPPHPNPQPQPHHRKIELQAPADLTYLQDNLARSALAKLDLHFPHIPPRPAPATVINLGGPAAVTDPTSQSTSPSHSGNASNPKQTTTNKANNHENKADEAKEKEEDDDPFRTRVRTLLTEFLTQTWTSAQSNLSINGLDATDIPIPHTATLSPAPAPTPESTSTATNTSTSSKTSVQTTSETAPEIEGRDFTYEPFDPRLQHKLASLYADLEKLTADVSRLRRTAPRSATQTYAENLDRMIALDEDAHEHTRTRIRDADTDADADMDEDGNGNGKPADQRGLELEFGFDTVDKRRKWNDDVRRMYGVGVDELVRLSGAGGGTMKTDPETTGREKLSLTETMGKAGRARDVVMDME